MNQGITIVFPLIIFALLDLAAIINMFTYRERTKIYRYFEIYALSVTIMQGISAVNYGCSYGVFHLPIPLWYVFQIISFISMVSAGYYWFRYMVCNMLKDECPRWLNCLAFFPFILISIAVLLSPITHYVFYIDKNANYVKGPGYALHAYVCWHFLICAIIAFIYSSIRNKKLDKRIVKALVFFTIPNIVGSYFQLSVFRGGYGQMGNSVGFILLYLEQFIESFNENKRLKALARLNESLAQRMDIIEKMSQVYFVSFYVDLRDDSYIELSSIDTIYDISKPFNNFSEVVKGICDNLVLPEFREEMREFCNLSTLNERFKDKKWITNSYKGVTTGWSQAYIIAGDRDEDGNLIHVFFNGRTIHEEKEREERQNEKLAKALIDAEAANKAKTNFLFNMSHDIRTPMNALLGYTTLIEKSIDSPKLIADYLEKMRASGDYLLTLINNILEVAKIDSGNEVVDETYTDLCDNSCSIVPLLENELNKKNLKFTQNMDIKHRYVMVDMDKIREINMNLLSNAIKYTPEGGWIHMEFKEIPCDKEGYACYVNSISDSGVGMSEEYCKRVFDSFSRERTTTESKIVGTGLGMAIVKKYIDLMGGRIEVESKLGEGTTFRTILLHRIVDDPEDIVENKEDNEYSLANFEGKRVILAEDNDINAEIASIILEDMGIKVDRAEDGIECIEMLYRAKEGYYDAVLMDIQMPNLNGYKATMRIREFEIPKKANIPIIAMTANAFEEDRQNAFKAGMNGHIAKPLEISVIIKELNKIWAASNK